MNTSRPRSVFATLSCSLGAVLLAACATPVAEPYPAPAADEASAEVQLMLVPVSRKVSTALYVPGAVRCSRPGVEALLNRTVEEPARLVAGSWQGRYKEVVRLPAGVPLPLLYRYQGYGDDWLFGAVVVLQPGQRYVFEEKPYHQGFTLKDVASGMAPVSLPPRWFHNAMVCPP